MLTDPISRLVRNAAHVGIDGGLYDLRQLALAAVDVVVGQMGFAREATLDDVLDALSRLAARMRPDVPTEWPSVAQTVVKGLLNDAHDGRRFTYRFADISDSGNARWEPYSFRLLSLRDTEFGPVLVASDQAITLFLHGLDVDLEDADRALAHVLQRQLEDRRFDSAARTAAQAERTSVGLSATLAELLDATRRDVGSTDWTTDLPQRLTRARRHVEERIADDDRFLEHLQGGLDSEASPEVRAVSGEIIDLLGRAKQVHLDLEKRLVGAREVFLSAQVRQRIARRRRLRMLTLGEDVLTPVLQLPLPEALAVTEPFAARALGVTVPRLARFDDLVESLWAAPRAPEPDAPPEEADVPADDEDLQGYPAEVVEAARGVLARTATAATPLSELLTAELPDDVAELVALSALWAFAPDPGDEEADGDGSDVGFLAAGLVALPTGATITAGSFRGPELILIRAGTRPEGSGPEVPGPEGPQEDHQ